MLFRAWISDVVLRKLVRWGTTPEVIGHQYIYVQHMRDLLWAPSCHDPGQYDLFWIISNKWAEIIDNATEMPVWASNNVIICHEWLERCQNMRNGRMIQLLAKRPKFVGLCFTTCHCKSTPQRQERAEICGHTFWYRKKRDGHYSVFVGAAYRVVDIANREVQWVKFGVSCANRDCRLVGAENDG